MRLFRKKRLQNDCERESEERVPFYLPCIYMKEIFDYLRSVCSKITVVTLAAVETPEGSICPAMAERLLVPAGFPFRETRCRDLKMWCGKKKWMVKMNVQKGEKP